MVIFVFDFGFTDAVNLTMVPPILITFVFSCTFSGLSQTYPRIRSIGT